MDSKRLNKYISDSGYCSRREADTLIEQGRVKLNGCIPALGSQVTDRDTVTVDDKPVLRVKQDKSDRIYIAYHKPAGITCTTERKVKGNIIQAVGFNQRIFPIGRLDKPSEGLILLTSDGDIVNKILRAENAHEKVYRVNVDKPINQAFVRRMSTGVPILDTVTKACHVSPCGQKSFDITLTQGLNRQIRRMCEHLGFEVTRLVRKRIMHLTLKGLSRGEWRHLTDSELSQLNSAVATSSKVAV